jgi:hypothetical protein
VKISREKKKHDVPNQSVTIICQLQSICLTLKKKFMFSQKYNFFFSKNIKTTSRLNPNTKWVLLRLSQDHFFFIFYKILEEEKT